MGHTLRMVERPTLRMSDRMRGGFPIVIMPIDQANAGPHGHDFVEFVFVRSGSGMHIHGSRRYPVFAGDCFVVMPGESHGYEEQQCLLITNVLFTPEVLRHECGDLADVGGFVRFFAIEPIFRTETSFRYKLHLAPSQQRTMTSLCAHLDRELSSESPGYRSMCTGLLLHLVVFISRCFDQTLARGDARQEFDGKQSMVEAAMAYLERNYAGNVLVEDIARSAFISSSRLSHVFRETTGMSLMDYLTRIRIDRAQQLLAETERGIGRCARLGLAFSCYGTGYAR